jgi:hypothetical protein
MDSGELFLPTPKKKEPNAVYGIMGKAGAGKDTSAQIIRDCLGANETYVYSFADPLKEMVAYVFDIPIVWMYDQELKTRPVNVTPSNEGVKKRMDEWVRENIAKSARWKWHLARPELSQGSLHMVNRLEEVSETLLIRSEEVFDKLYNNQLCSMTNNFPRYCSDIKKTYLISIRMILQYMGTEVIRGCVDELFWCEVKRDPISYQGKTLIIPDCRFQSEVDYILTQPNSSLFVVKNIDLEESDTKHSSEQFVDCIDEYVARVHPTKTITYLYNSFEDDSMEDLKIQINDILNIKDI